LVIASEAYILHPRLNVALLIEIDWVIVNNQNVVDDFIPGNTDTTDLKIGCIFGVASIYSSVSTNRYRYD
jgi:hypothetical protein